MYHLFIGVDLIYLYDNEDTLTYTRLFVCNPRVKVIHFRNAHAFIGMQVGSECVLAAGCGLRAAGWGLGTAGCGLRAVGCAGEARSACGCGGVARAPQRVHPGCARQHAADARL